MARFQIVDFDEPGVVATGKGSRNIISRLARTLTKLGVPSEILHFSELMEQGPTEDPQSYVLLHYNELFVVQNNKVGWLRAREREMQALGHKLLHSVEQGQIVGNKVRQNQVLTAAGVPMPTLVRVGDRFDTVFSNAVSDAHVPVQLIKRADEIDTSRYNTEYVDCRHEYDGKLWHVCIRAQAIGGQVLFSWVRASDEPNVRTRNTPVDAGLIRHFHERLVRPNLAQIQEIALGVKKALGVGLFAHDILPCAQSGRLLLCETNFKFYEGFYRFHMSPIRAQHPVPALFDGRKVGRRMARALIAELELKRKE
ncbi:hypothetical protein AVO45_01785 [Ruegeria marisrubri]|uniref:ATP-grasp domain-containing protein n=1 Tax=Ruegeria marisrubri TaxID=1685379 RepID=A0A117KH45_9RHOB|nr:hypothetical protein [Ruegeria marisrubri]KUJ85739.1 hypothetical protein AVO45_01785 [Ruegeria marisrubri]